MLIDAGLFSVSLIFPIFYYFCFDNDLEWYDEQH